ncbi:MAG TPA: OsmC family protein [Gammaproteobacteria bacterium]|nr:OsmC family protein [Gammaproteobacteria bacterium]
MHSLRVDFPNEAGQGLAGILDRPRAVAPRAFALLAHCFTCNKNYKGLRNVSRALCEAGIAVLRFDFTGLGESEGDFSATTFSTNISDILAAARWLARHHQPPALLVGHSLGGVAMMAAAPRIDACRAVATLASPSDPAHVADHFADRHEEIRSRGEAEITVGGIAYRIRRAFLDDLRKHSMGDILARMDRPLLILHSPLDRTVAIEHAARLFAGARHPKSFVSLDRADHLLSREADARYAGTVIAAWASRYLEDVPAAEAEDRVEGVEVTIGREHYCTRVRAGAHQLVLDEPRRLGGGDCGPNPYEALSAALGSCTAITLRMYADRKQWPLEEVRVVLRHSKVHVEDCRGCEEGAHTVDLIRRDIQLKGRLSQEQRQRLLEIADRCPVHRSLHQGVRVETRLLD